VPKPRTGKCPICSATWSVVPGQTGRPRLYCGDDCKEVAHLARRIARRALAAVSLPEVSADAA